MQPFFKFSAAAIACLLATAGAQANLLVNPGAETGDLTGWVVGGVSSPTVDDGTFDSGIKPHSGLYAFVGNNGAFGSLSQKVSLAGQPNVGIATVSFWEQGLDQDDPSDNGFVTLTFLDGAQNALGVVTTPVVDSHSGSWQNYQGSFVIPTGTVSIGYAMNFTRNQGSDLDAFIDDNSLTVSAVPEPASLPMLGAGVLLVGGLASRRAKSR